MNKIIVFALLLVSATPTLAAGAHDNYQLFAEIGSTQG